MKTEKSNVERAIDYIADHPGARSNEIEEKLGIKYVAALLADPVKAGYLVACKIEQPGKPPANEYRLSAAVSKDQISWKEFRISKRSRLPIKNAEPRPMRKPSSPEIAAPPAKTTDASKPSTNEIPWPTESQLSAASSAPAVTPRPIVPKPPQIVFLLATTGELRIEIPDGETLLVSRRETQALGKLLIETETIWN